LKIVELRLIRRFHRAKLDSELLIARPSHIDAGDLNRDDRFTYQQLKREAHAGMVCRTRCCWGTRWPI